MSNNNSFFENLENENFQINPQDIFIETLTETIYDNIFRIRLDIPNEQLIQEIQSEITTIQNSSIQNICLNYNKDIAQILLSNTEEKNEDIKDKILQRLTEKMEKNKDFRDFAACLVQTNIKKNYKEIEIQTEENELFQCNSKQSKSCPKSCLDCFKKIINKFKSDKIHFENFNHPEENLQTQELQKKI